MLFCRSVLREYKHSHTKTICSVVPRTRNQGEMVGWLVVVLPSPKELGRFWPLKELAIHHKSVKPKPKELKELWDEHLQQWVVGIICQPHMGKAIGVIKLKAGHIVRARQSIELANNKSESDESCQRVYNASLKRLSIEPDNMTVRHGEDEAWEPLRAKCCESEF